MSFFLICVALIIQHFTRPSSTYHLALQGYIHLFSANGLIGRFGEATTLALWLFIPFALITIGHYYLGCTYASEVIFLLFLAFFIWLTIGYNSCLAICKAISEDARPPKVCDMLIEPQNLDDFAQKQQYITLCLLRLLFAPIFWIALFNGYGALGVFLVYVFCNNYPENKLVQILVVIIEWIPARLLALSIALQCKPAYAGKTFLLFANTKSSEELVSQHLVPGVFNHASHNSLKPKKLLYSQLVIWLACLAFVTLMLLVTL